MRALRIGESGLLAGLLLLALAIRLVGLGWGLPFVYHPDEPTHVGIVLNILKTGDWNPHWFKYPSFRIYVSVPVAIAYFLYAVSRGRVRAVAELTAARMVTVGSGTTTAPELYYGLRLLMTLFGVVSVAYLYRWAHRRWNGRVAGLAALFLVVSPLHVVVGHWYRPDTVLALFSGAAVLATVDLYRQDRLRGYVLSGALAGLAASVKYNAAVLQLIPIFLAHLLARRSLFDWRVWITPLVALLVFVLITPYAVLDLPAFLDGFAYEINHYYVRGHMGADSTGGLLGNLAWYADKLFYFDGVLVLLAAAAPFLVSRERRGQAILLLAWPAVVLLLNTTAKVRTPLALVPMYLILYLLAAISVDAILGGLVARVRSDRLGAWASPVLVVAVLAVPTARTVTASLNFHQPDVRTVAREWLLANVPPDARIALEAYGPVMEGPGVRYLGSLAQHGPEWYQAAGYDYLVASHFWTVFVTPDLYTPQVATYQRLFEFPLARAMEGPVQYMWDPIKEIRIHRVPVPERYTLSMAEGDAPWLTEGFYPPEAVDG
ncbi:MAG: hypothetical protein FJZ90_13785, partial [Chloroflexi bacterium]|nr:hypothetical protein [Chloroflexota bacterium]